MARGESEKSGPVRARFQSLSLCTLRHPGAPQYAYDRSCAARFVAALLQRLPRVLAEDARSTTGRTTSAHNRAREWLGLSGRTGRGGTGRVQRCRMVAPDLSTFMERLLENPSYEPPDRSIRHSHGLVVSLTMRGGIDVLFEIETSAQEENWAVWSAPAIGVSPWFRYARIGVAIAEDRGLYARSPAKMRGERCPTPLASCGITSSRSSPHAA